MDFLLKIAQSFFLKMYQIKLEGRQGNSEGELLRPEVSAVVQDVSFPGGLTVGVDLQLVDEQTAVVDQ